MASTFLTRPVVSRRPALAKIRAFNIGMTDTGENCLHAPWPIEGLQDSRLNSRKGKDFPSEIDNVSDKNLRSRPAVLRRLRCVTAIVA